MKDFISELGADPRFQIILKAARRARPSVPAYSLGADPDDWKYRSGMQAGFDLALSFFGVSATENVNE